MTAGHFDEKSHLLDGPMYIHGRLTQFYTHIRLPVIKAARPYSINFLKSCQAGLSALMFFLAKFAQVTIAKSRAAVEPDKQAVKGQLTVRRAPVTFSITTVRLESLGRSSMRNLTLH